MREREGLAFQAPEFPEWEVPPPLTEEPREVQTAPSPGPGGRRAVPPPRTPKAPGPGAHSQLLQARVELHVHGVERVQAAPVLYVSMEEKRGQVSGGATERRWLESQRNLGANPIWVLHRLGHTCQAVFNPKMPQEARQSPCPYTLLGSDFPISGPEVQGGDSSPRDTQAREVAATFPRRRLPAPPPVALPSAATCSQSQEGCGQWPGRGKRFRAAVTRYAEGPRRRTFSRGPC